MTSLMLEEWLALEHTHRYRLTTPEALGRRICPDQPQTAYAVIERLQDRGYLSMAHPLFGNRVYYQITDRACAEYFRHDEAYRPLSRPALVKAYGVLAFCCLGRETRERILREEFQKQFPALCRPGFPFPDYVVNRSGKSASPLGMLSIDHGGGAERQIRRVHQMVDRLCQIPGFRDLLTQETVALNVITATAEKAATLTVGFQRRPLPSAPHIVILPELLPLQEPDR